MRPAARTPPSFSHDSATTTSSIWSSKGAASTALFYASAGDLERARALVDQAMSKRDRVPDEAWGAITTELALRGDRPDGGRRSRRHDTAGGDAPRDRPFDGFARHVFGNVGALPVRATVRAHGRSSTRRRRAPTCKWPPTWPTRSFALREHGSAAPAARLPWEDLDRLRTWAYEPHLAELAIAAMSHGVLRASVAIWACATIRGALRTVIDRHGDPVATLAHEELDELRTARR